MSRWKMVKNVERSKVIREAHNADQHVSYDGGRVYVDGLLAYDPEAPPPADIDDEIETKLWMFETALKELAREDRRFLSNAHLWQRWDTDRRLWWISHAEYQAEAGLDTIGVIAVARAVEVRLTRTRP